MGGPNGWPGLERLREDPELLLRQLSISGQSTHVSWQRPSLNDRARICSLVKCGRGAPRSEEALEGDELKPRGFRRRSAPATHSTSTIAHGHFVSNRFRESVESASRPRYLSSPVDFSTLRKPHRESNIAYDNYLSVRMESGFLLTRRTGSSISTLWMSKRGAATLIVTPSGESMLIDSGMADPGNRDLGRIVEVVNNVAKLDHLDHALVTHWHSDHFGNHAALAAKIKIHHFWDRGIPDTLIEDPQFAEHVAPYRSASQNQSKTVKVGELLPLKSGATPLKVQVVTVSEDVIPNTGEPNPYAAEHKPQPVDTSDNAKSISLLLTFGPFKFVCCGDLTWNTEAKLMTPNNPLGHVDVFMATHHGLDISNNPVMVLALDPRVARVTCNGPIKGSGPVTLSTLKRVKSLQAMYQLHKNIKLADSIRRSGCSREYCQFR